MAYTKKYNYPSLRKPGVYPPGSIKEHGLNTDNLEKFSLGNWSELDENKKQLWFGLPPNEVIQVDEDWRITGFQEKPDNPTPLPNNPDYCLASMGNLGYFTFI